MNNITDGKVYSVHEYLDLVNISISRIRVVIEGEITSKKEDFKGNIYFSLSEVKSKQQAIVNCALWSRKSANLSLDLKDGDKVQVTGYADVYKPSSRFTFKVDKIVPVGEGALKKAFEKLRKELEQKGYFSNKRKRVLPQYPEKIALLTSKSGAAITDFTTHLGKFGIKIYFLDRRVEGINAINSIASGIYFINSNYPDIDLIVLTRGGGSLESLQAYNSLEVARAIYSSRIPILSAIGHEDDITISDLVADRRASTPTDAGNIVTEGWREGKQKVDLFSQLFLNTINQLIQRYRLRLNEIDDYAENRFSKILLIKKNEISNKLNIIIKQIDRNIKIKRTMLSSIATNLLKEIRFRISTYKNVEKNFRNNFRIYDGSLSRKYKSLLFSNEKLDEKFQATISKLRESLLTNKNKLSLSDPSLKLKQGYSIVRDKNNNVVRDIQELFSGSTIFIQFSNGSAESSVKKVERNGDA